LRAAGLVLLIVALAGPRWPDLHTRIATQGIAIVMVVDVSGSMAEADFTWGDERITRLEAAKRAFTLFVAGGEGLDGEHFEGRPDDLIGLVTFATRPESSCPLTLSHSALLRILATQEPRTLPTESQTNIGDAIAWGIQRLESDRSRRKVMILLTDGEHNVPPPALKPRQAAQMAASLGVPIYALDAGPLTPVSSPTGGGEGGKATDSEFSVPALLRGLSVVWTGFARLSCGCHRVRDDCVAEIAVADLDLVPTLRVGTGCLGRSAARKEGSTPLEQQTRRRASLPTVPTQSVGTRT
jgi:hypothetical protein